MRLPFDRSAALALVLAHLAVAAVVVGPDGSFEGPPTYRAIAENLLAGHGYSIDGASPTCYRSPLFAFLLAGSIGVFGDLHVYVVPLVQLLVSLGAGFLAAAVAGSVFGSRRAATVAALVYAAHVLLLIEHFALRETFVFTLLVVAGAWGVTRPDPGWRTAVVLGLACGVAYLTRPSGILVLPAILAATFVAARARREPLGRWAISVVVLVGTLLLVAAPWMQFTASRFGRVFPSTTCMYGQAAYAGNNPWISGRVYPWIDIDAWTEHLWKQQPATIEDPLEREDWYLARALETIEARPWQTVKMMGLRVLALYSPITTPFGYGEATMVDGRLELSRFRMRSLASRLVVGGFTSLLFLAVAAYIATRPRAPNRERRALEIYVLVLFALITAAHAFTLGETRYRLPLDPLLVILAAGFVDGWMRRTATGSDTPTR